ncbi:hypothetical protein, partial [Couchioplanes caeruleus]
VLDALTRRCRGGAATHVSVSLERTARWLLGHDTVAATAGEVDPDAYRVDLGGGWSGVSPPGMLDGRALSWPRLPAAYGAAPAAWPLSSDGQ